MKTSKLLDNPWGSPNRMVPMLAIVPLVLMLGGCAPSTVVASLDAVTLSAEIAVSFLSAAGVNVDPQVGRYISAVGEASKQTAVLLQSGETGAKLSADILAVFDGVVKPVLAPSVSPKVLAILDAVDASVRTLLLHFKSSDGTARALASPTITPVPFKASATDRKKLVSIQKRAAAVAANAKPK